MIDCHYEPFRLPVSNWLSLDQFLDSSGFRQGIHVIRLPSGDHLDVALTMDLHQDESALTPVFLSGAVSKREGSVPPYFSGIGMSRSTGTPIVSIADPIFHRDGNIKLGWYGGISRENLQSHVTALLAGISVALGELLLVGGSGGGFASLMFAERLGPRASAFVWNPQTDLLHYVPQSVSEYLQLSLGDPTWTSEAVADWESAHNALTHGGIQHQIPSIGHSAGVLMLQNESDWHLGKHALPLIDRSGLVTDTAGIYVSPSDRHVVAVGPFGVGHAVPDSSVINLAVRRACEGMTPRQILPEVLSAFAGLA